MNHLTQLTRRIALLATCLGAVAVTQAQDFNGPRVFLQATSGGHFMAWGARYLQVDALPTSLPIASVSGTSRTPGLAPCPRSGGK